MKKHTFPKKQYSVYKFNSSIHAFNLQVSAGQRKGQWNDDWQIYVGLSAL